MSVRGRARRYISPIIIIVTSSSMWVFRAAVRIFWAAAKMSRETLLAKSAYFYQGPRPGAKFAHSLDMLAKQE